ncbi:hypothetical protein EDC14_1008127 [Hydrogenispora ethanolica]|uniref:Uncharacterized protein n=1 Tax=Hydrogenispora ethanolica TaxID=1082276 RepID=A0A4V2QF85_HYDET|nr:hypothetical protein [Hydrogenispora ethanolica]TCL70977.1 hypothetical protein EDC14_1008127 [Hydrogenispora ethanolica]
MSANQERNESFLLLAGIVIVLTFLAVISASPRNARPASQAQTAAQKEHQGSYLDYPYSYSRQDGKFIFRFSPTPLPPDEGTVLGAMLKAIKDIDHPMQLSDTTPHIKKASAGTEIVYFIGTHWTYNFLRQKNADGTVRGFTAWKE